MHRAIRLLIAAALIALPALGADTLTVARGTISGNKANPYSTGTNLVWDIYAALFDTLTRVTNTGELIPWAAERWEQDGNGAWRFYLRGDLAFSNGEPFDAAAVVTTIDYLKSEAGQREPAATLFSGIASARALDARTVEIASTVRDPLLPQRVSSLWIVAPRAWQTLGRDAFAAAPVGSGPYKVVEWSPQQVRMTAVDTAWRHGPAQKLEALVIIDPSARTAALTAGRADIAIASLNPESASSLEASGGSVYVDQLPAVIGVAFNTVRDPRFRDARVRQALNYAVDKDAIARLLLAGKSRPASQVGRSGFFGFNPAVTPYPYDPARARALLAEAGLAKGFAFEMELTSGASLWDAIFLQVANDLKAVGVEMTIRMAPSEAIAKSVQSGNWRGSAYGAAYYSAAFDALEPMRQHSCLWHAPWFCDETITAAVKTAMAAPDVDSRRAATEKVMALSHDLAQSLFVYESVSFVGLGPRVKKFRTDFGFIRYEMIDLAP